jgi:hypothetical protein
MKVVSNSSILIGLSSIGKLSILHTRFPQGIIVPEAVWEEVVVTGRGLPGADKVAQAKWIFTQQVQNKFFPLSLQASLDRGEAEVIALSQEINADILLLDEKSARNVAVRLQYPVLGTVGILIWAKQTFLLSSLSCELDLLQQKGGFRISREVYEYALQQAGEK